MTSPLLATRDPLPNFGIEAALQHVERVARRFAAAEPTTSLHAMAATIHEFCIAAESAEQAGATREELQEASKPAWPVHASSPFIRRLQTWPRGYPGDFETIEQLLDGRPAGTPGTPAYWVEYLALQSTVAQQHRNKVRVQAQAIRDALRAGASRVLLIACGSAPDLVLVEEDVARSGATLVLNDADPEALELAQARLASVRSRLTAVPGNVLRSLRTLRQHGPYDLVVAGGLCDYLTDRQVTFLLKHVFQELLAPGGSLLFTNIGRGNPYRTWMEYCARWELIERSDADLRRLIAAAAVAPSDPAVDVHLSQDETGLTWIARAHLAVRDPEQVRRETGGDVRPMAQTTSMEAQMGFDDLAQAHPRGGQR